ncbi:hypothetical protein [Streptomyces spiralis]|uniref:hypothetical protein n=1 Tax=Streptomyces spiralis TaxID=66376 RepID=UPI0033E50638
MPQYQLRVYTRRAEPSSDRNGMLSESEETHMTTQVPCSWVGIDASKGHHWRVATDDTGTTVAGS